jgi:SAM-dependent methyltransferase
MIGFLQKLFPGSLKVRLLYRLTMFPLYFLKLRKVKPFDSGQALGTPIIRYYWDVFLAKHRADVRGVGLEIGNITTLKQYGGANISRAEALDLTPSAETTIVADLSHAWELPEAQFDVFINQYVLHVVPNDVDALYHSVRQLKPGGVLLVNFVCHSSYLGVDGDAQSVSGTQVWHWYTPARVRQMLATIGLGPADFQLETFGSYRGLLTYLYDLPVEAMSPAERAHKDADCPLLVAVRVQRPPAWAPGYAARH